MKKLFLILVLSLSITYLFSQKTSSAYLPAKTANIPDWMNLFYAGVTNAHQLENAYHLYYQTHAFEKNTYTQYYKRWMIENQRYVQDDGTLLKPIDNSSPKPESHPQQLSKNPLSSWSLIGPIETFRPAWDNPLQPSLPWQVNIYAFDVAPSNLNILYACPETGGVFKSIDKGLNWVSVSDNIKLGTMTAIAVHPTNQDIVYASAGNNVYQTVDGGVSWTTIFTVSGLSCDDIAICLFNPDIIFLAGNTGLYKSVNSGLTFVQVVGMTGTIYDIETNTLRDSSVFVLSKAVGDTLVRFYRSYDAGTTFTQINTGWIAGASNAGRMTISAADTNYMYTVLLMDGNIDAPVILRSIDAGSNWTHTCTGIQNSLTGNNSSPLGMSNGQGYYDMSIMASSINPTELIVATTSAYKSVDSGNTFTSVGGYIGNFPLHPDIQEMKMIGNDAWISTDGGLNYSTDFFSITANTYARNKGIYGSDFWGYGQGWNEDLATGGRYHNGNTALYDGYPAGNALRLGGGEAGTGYGMVGRDMFVAHSDIGAYVLPKTFTGLKNNFNFSLYPNEDGYGWDASEMEFFPSCFNHLYIGKDSSLWKSTDGGVSYIQVYNFHQRVKKFEVCRSNPQVMYVATNGNLYKTIDGGVSWTIVIKPLGVSMSNLSLSVSYTDENILWITSKNNTSNNKIFKTIDGGTTWINLTTALINSYNFQIINHQAGTDGGVYITSQDYAKIFYRNNSMLDWTDFSDSLPKEYRPLTTKPFYKKNKLRTAGNRGIWEVDFYEDGDPVAQPTVDKLESTCLRDTFYFDDFSAVNHALVSWQWTFPGATYISSTTDRNPRILYPAIGTYMATLTVTQNGINDTKSISVTISGNACTADSVPGLAVQLAGNTAADYVSIPPLGMNTNELTISAWIKADGIQQDYAPIFMYDGDAAGFNFLPDSNHLGFHWPTGAWWWDSGLIVPDGEWAHVAMVVSPTEIRLYLNGKSAAYSNTVPTVDFNLNTSRLGNYHGWSGRYFKGLIDEVCIWNRALSIDEIRATRHLTKTPATDTSIVAYYQFNELSGVVLDKVGVRHATLSSGATRVISTGPFAFGFSTKSTISNGGFYTFSGTDIEMNFPTSGGSVYPNGDVWVSKLNYHPDQDANLYPMINRYWVVNNYGSNSAFSVLDTIKFTGLPALPIINPPNYCLYKRSSNADGASWSTPQDTADAYSLNGNNSNLTFSFNNDINSFSQFSLNGLTVIGADINESPSTSAFEVTTYPVPSQNELFLVLNSSLHLKNSVISIYDITGKQLVTTNQNLKNGKNIIMLNTASLSNGNYLVSIEIEGIKKIQQFVINR